MTVGPAGPTEAIASPSDVVPALAATGVTKTYGATKALDDVTLSVSAGRVHALVGGNGSGKSTFIKVLAGVASPEGGRLLLSGAWSEARSHNAARAKAAGLHFVHQQNSTFPDLTVAENLALGRGFEHTRVRSIAWKEQRQRARAVLDRFQIDVSPDAAMDSLNAANQMMIAIARALQDQDQDQAGRHSVLVLDEPTASLPKHEVDVLLGALRRYAAAGQTIVYVSHRLEEVTALADEATILRNGRVASVLTGAEITHSALVEGITGTRTSPPSPSASSASPGSDRAFEQEQPVLTVRTSDGGEAIRLLPGEIVAVAGLLGSGRSRLLKQLFGVLPRPGVAVEVGGSVLRPRDVREAMGRGVAFVPESRLAEAVFPELSIAENLSIARLEGYSTLGYVPPRRERGIASRLIRRFGVKAASPAAPLTALSGGNQQKVVLARWLQREPRVLLLDEPTQGVDIGARTEIYTLVRHAAREGMAVLVASSDFAELAELCERAFVVNKGHVVGTLEGPLTEDQLNDAVYQLEKSA